MVPITAWLSDAKNFRLQHGRPLVTLSYAQSLDGSISTRRGVSTSLSGPDSMKLTHQLRAAHDAILVGIGTVLADDPRLTVRLVEGNNPQPVVLDSNLRLPLNASLFQSDHHPWIATSQSAPRQTEAHQSPQIKTADLQARGARLLHLPSDSQGRLSLTALLADLAGRGIASLMVEGGAHVITSFLQQNLVDQIVLTIAPVFLGGLRGFELHQEQLDALPVDHGPPQKSSRSESHPALPRLQEMGYDRLGQDLIIWGRL